MTAAKWSPHGRSTRTGREIMAGSRSFGLVVLAALVAFGAGAGGTRTADAYSDLG